ncbi:MAG: L-threonylcarbamoyladenylate synthase, partial [Muribaculaceae bacterium]
NLIGEDGSIGIRVTKERFSKELCRKFGRPIVSTSANISGQKSPAMFLQISQEIKESVDYIVNYRQNDNSSHTPSSIIKLGQDGVFKLIRS